MVKSAKRKTTVVTSSDVNMDMFNGRRVTRSMGREIKATGLKKNHTQMKYKKVAKFTLINNFEKEKQKAKKLRQEQKQHTKVISDLKEEQNQHKKVISDLKEERFNNILEDCISLADLIKNRFNRITDEHEKNKAFCILVQRFTSLQLHDDISDKLEY